MGPEVVKGRVVRLEVENFKSYQGKETIGPFLDFTTIIGPNGSGKSNLMDAISFVLGVKTGVLRGSNLRELLYHNNEAADAAHQPTRGQVTLVFQDPSGAEVLFSRAILPSAGGDSYASQYRVDGRAVGAEAYTARLESYGILVKARNFLVFQGDIENVAQMQPGDLSRMFEQVCGSVALAPEYAAAEGRVRAAEETTALTFTKKRAITAEKRQKKEQKAEAERHQSLVTEHAQLRTRHALWQIYHIEEDLDAARKEHAAQSKKLAELAAAEADAEAEAEAARREQAGLAKERLLLEKAIKKKRGEGEKKNPALIKVREQLAHAQRRIKGGEREAQAARRRAAEHAAKLAALREQLEGLEDARRTVEEEIEESRRGRLDLSPALLEEYNAIKRTVGAATAALEADRAALATAADADGEALRLLRDARGAAASRAADLAAAAAADGARLAALGAAREAAAAERAAAAAERERLTDERRRVDARRGTLETRLAAADAELRELKATKKESAREAARRQLVADLRREHPGKVFGAVTDLGEPTAQKYRLAMAVVMGKDFDSVVVDSPETAMACIRAVKARRLPPVTFLPADTIRVKEVPPALRALGGSARLAIDCLHVEEPGARRAFAAVCGATLLCDTAAEAREVAFGGGEVRHKVVALDGTAFLKTGLITGGMTDQMEARAQKWDEQRVAEAKRERDAAAAALAATPTLRELTEALQAAEAAAARLENAERFAAADAKATAAKVKEGEEQVAALQRESESKAPAVAKLEAQIAERQRRVDALQRRINEVADRQFQAFSKKIGVASVREYEDTALAGAERLARQRLEVGAQAARVRAQAEYEAQADPGAEAAAKEAEVAALREQVAALEQEEAQFTAAAASVTAELDRLAASSSELKARVDGAAAQVAARRAAASRAADAAAACRRQIASVEGQLERLRGARRDVVDAAAMDEVGLPAAGAPGRAARRRGGGAAAAMEVDAAAGGEEEDEEDEEEEPEEEEEGDAMEADGDGAGPSAAPAARTKRVAYDFAVLGKADKQRAPAARAAHEKELLAAIEGVGASLSRMAPNLKALEQYDAVRERERAQLEELEGARREAKAASEAFNAVRARRHALFSRAFAHVAASIDPIYKELTRSAAHPGGGQAYLSLENSEDPYLGGVKFSAMPPTKRFRDMEQLSGGEKTVAALALLFAVHSFHPSPFFVLDEVDAALDASNVARVAAYVRRMTRPGQPGAFQGIVISLKDVFYEKADGLVGVCRDPARGSSTTHTFDLNRFGPPAGAAS